MDDISCLEVDDWLDEPPKRLPGSFSTTSVQQKLSPPPQQHPSTSTAVHMQPMGVKRQEPTAVRQPLEHVKRASLQPLTVKPGSKPSPKAAQPSASGQQNAFPSAAQSQGLGRQAVSRRIMSRQQMSKHGPAERPASQSQQERGIGVQRASTSEQHSMSQPPEARDLVQHTTISEKRAPSHPPEDKTLTRASQGQAKRRIPGPAGVLLDAQQRGLQVSQMSDIWTSGGGTVSRACLPGLLMDPDFLSPAWLGALQTLGLRHFDAAALQHTVRSVLDIQTSSKIPQLLALVASLRPDGSGSAHAMCKDPTGTVGAGIHNAVLAAHPALGSGCVLLLQKVTALKLPSQACCLCVTADNIVQVIPASDFPSRPLQITAAPVRDHVSQHDRAGWQDGIPGSPQLADAFPQSSSTATAVALGVSSSKIGAARSLDTLVGGCGQQRLNQRPASGLATPQRQVASPVVDLSSLDASPSQPQPVSRSHQQASAGRSSLLGSMQSWAEPVRMDNYRAQREAQPSRRQPEIRYGREEALRSVFDFDVEPELGDPPLSGQVGSGVRLQGGPAASAGRKGMAELTDELDDLADTGLWTP